MDNTNFITTGTVAGVLSFIAAMSVSLHMPLLTAFIADPNTASELTSVLVGVMALFAGVSKGIHPKAK
jgi:hypothetical protein